MLIWLPFGWIVYEHMSGALTARSLNMRMGWLFKKQQNIALDKLTTYQFLKAQFSKHSGLLRCNSRQAAPFILSGVKKINSAMSFSNTETH